MKSYDFEAVVYDGDVYCSGCLPTDVEIDDEDGEVSPIFADTEWDYPGPSCCVCGLLHDYMNILGGPDESDQRE